MGAQIRQGNRTMGNGPTMTKPATFAEIVDQLNGWDIPSSDDGPRLMLSTWEQAQSIGMTREQWEAGEEVSPGLRMFSGCSSAG